MAVRLRWLAIVALLLTSCDSSAIVPLADYLTQSAATLVPTLTPASTLTPVPQDTGWRNVAPGIEYREWRVTINDRSDRLRLARVDPAQVRVRVLYQPDSPRRVNEWLLSTGAQMVINGNYFDPQNRALGLIISDGARTGVNYEGFGGMLAIGENSVKVRGNVS